MVMIEYCDERNENDIGSSHAQFTRINGKNHGTSTPPMFEPELNIPVARARSLFGNHSAVALMAAGKFPPSPRPSKILQTKKPIVALPNSVPISGAKACSIEASPQNEQAKTNPQRSPNTSIKRPMISMLTA